MVIGRYDRLMRLYDYSMVQTMETILPRFVMFVFSSFLVILSEMYIYIYINLAFASSCIWIKQQY